jgi:flavin-dependent dehydrogenase
MNEFGDDIHAFLPRDSRIEFGAITPKANHLTINIAGARVDSRYMDAFLDYPPLRQLLSFVELERPCNPKDFIYYRGRFAISAARNFYGDRYVCLGDAAGLVRAFKGKGINSACQTALWAAETALKVGVSRLAFEDYYRTACHLILKDLPYGQAMRQLAIIGSRLGLLDRLIAIAEGEPTLRRALFDAVSAHRPYRAIAADVFYPPALIRLISAFVKLGFRRSVAS